MLYTYMYYKELYSLNNYVIPCRCELSMLLKCNMIFYSQNLRTLIFI